MANLYPQNTTYWSSNQKAGINTLRAIAKRNIENIATPKVSKKTGIPTQFQSLSSIPGKQISEPTTESWPSFPVNEPLSEAPFDRFQNLQQYVKSTGEETKARSDQPWYTPITETTKVAKMPPFLGWGVYMTDPNSSNVAENRTYIPAENKAILWNRDPRLYQVDHIIPLWAGGKDTLANKEILTTSEHAIKSKAQAVPFTLMANKLISPQEAKVMATNWADKDITWIPEEASKWWLMDVKLAQQKYEEWSRVKPVTFKDVLKEVPEVLKSTMKPLAAKEGEDEAEQFMKSLAGWFISESTFGVLPYEQESKSWWATAWWFLGKVAGNVVAFATLWWIIGKAAQALGKLKFIKPLMNSGRIAEDIFEWWMLTREGATIAKTAWEIWRNIPVAVKWAGVWDAIASSRIWNLAKKIKIQSVLKSAGMMNAYGQIRITAPALVWLQQMPDMAERVKQAAIDTTYGWLLWQAGHTIPWYASVGAGAFTIGLISGSDAEQATLDAFTMMALHGLWQGESNKRKKLPTLEEAMNNVADRTASEHIFDRTGIKVDKLNPDSAINIRTKLQDARSKKIVNDNLDLNEAMKLRLQDEVAIRQLLKGNMSKAVRRQADIEDMQSIGDKLKTKEQLQDISTPDEIIQTLKWSEDHIFNNTPLERTPNTKMSLENKPIGDFPLSGVASQIDGGLPKQRVDYFFKSKDNGLAAQNVLLIERSELENFFRELNNSKSIFSADKLKNNQDTLFAHPENSVQAFGMVKVPDAKTPEIPWVVRIKGKDWLVDIVPLWWSARKSRIADVENWWRIHSFNQTALDSGDNRLLNHNNNKDTLAESMRKNGVKILTASLDDRSTPRTSRAWEPFLLLNINQDHWLNSAELNNKRNYNTLWDNMDTLVQKATKAKDPQAIVNIIGKMREDAPDLSAPEMIHEVATAKNDPDAAFATEVLKTFEDGIKSWSARQLENSINKKYGQVLDQDSAIHIINKANDFTVENAFDILYDWIKDWRANKATEIMYKYNLTPFFDKMTKNQVNVDGVPVNDFYLKMPLLAKADTEFVTPTNKAKENFLLSPEEIAPKTEKIPTTKAQPAKIQTEYKKFTDNPKEYIPSYEKYNTFTDLKKSEEFDSVKKQGTELIDNFEIHWHESDADILRRMNWQLNNLIEGYQWSASEKKQAKDLLGDYAKLKIEQQKAPKSQYFNNFDDKELHYKGKPMVGKQIKGEIQPSVAFKSIYPDIYSEKGRRSDLGQNLASTLNIEQLTKRAARTNNNSLANELQSSSNLSKLQGKKNVSLLWDNVLSEFDRLWKKLSWRKKALDTNKFNKATEKMSSDIITWGSRAWTSKTVNPEIANYEMDINIWKIDNLPKELKTKYEELQKEGYGHVYSSSSMNTKAYKGRTSWESSYNIFKYIKEYVDGKEDTSLVKEIYGDDSKKAERALQVLKTWRLGEDLTLSRLSKLEEHMYPKDSPDIAKKIEERKIDLNRQLPSEYTEAGLSPISAEDLREVPEYNTPLSHSLMSLAKYNINDLKEDEVKKLAKSFAYTLWPAVKNSLINQ